MSYTESNTIRCTTVDLSDSGLHVCSFDDTGDMIAESRVRIDKIMAVIESDAEEDCVRLQHGPDPISSE